MNLQKNGYDTFMEKEINEQSECIYKVAVSDMSFVSNIILNAEQIIILGCGSSYHAGLLGKVLFEKHTTSNLRCFNASNFYE